VVVAVGVDAVTQAGTGIGVELDVVVGKVGFVVVVGGDGGGGVAGGGGGATLGLVMASGRVGAASGCVAYKVGVLHVAAVVAVVVAVAVAVVHAAASVAAPWCACGVVELLEIAWVAYLALLFGRGRVDSAS